MFPQMANAAVNPKTGDVDVLDHAVLDAFYYSVNSPNTTAVFFAPSAFLPVSDGGPCSGCMFCLANLHFSVFVFGRALSSSHLL